MSERPIGMMIAVMEAYRDGKQIQSKPRRSSASNPEWGHVDAPTWDWWQYDYRVKPEPREWWIAEYPTRGFSRHDSPEAAECALRGIRGGKVTLFREVIE